MNKREVIIELAARFHVFLLLNMYGLGKIVGGQFYRRGKLPEEVAKLTLDEAGAYELAWTFFGYSQAYICFIGLSQILGGCMLLFDKTKLLGVAVLMPIIINIIVFDVIFLDSIDALISACIYFVLLMLILYLNRSRVLGAIAVLTSSIVIQNQKGRWKKIAWAGLLFLIFFAIEQAAINLVWYFQL